MDNPLLTAAQMRVLEQAAIASGQVTGLELMERAGRGAVDAILEEWPAFAAAPGRAVVLCGPGNNGGDGFVVARVLSGKGWDLEVFLYGDAAKLPPDALTNYERWLEIGAVAAMPEDGLPLSAGVTLVIDALFGTGMSRPLKAIGKTLRDICDCVAAGGGQPLERRLPHFPPCVSLDLPSGLCSDSGRMIGTEQELSKGGARALCAAADLALSFHSLKPGHVLADGPRLCGKVKIVDIGLSDGPSDGCLSAARPRRAIGKRFGHKYDHGHALILTGSMGRTGAARLSARAALRIGAGLVTCAAPGAAMMECAAHLTAIMLRRCDDAAALTDLLEDKRINALCLGPGIGVSDRTTKLLDAALATERSIVLDADALTVLASRDDPFAMLHSKCILTPHGGEFSRLFPEISNRLFAPAMTGPAYSKADATRDAAARAGCTVLFKGPDTVIADHRGRARVSAAVGDRSAPWLATAGAGDVLAGIVAGLLSRGQPPLEAASSAAWLHVEAARAFGPGLIAEDLPEMLPRVLTALRDQGGRASSAPETSSNPST